MNTKMPAIFMVLIIGLAAMGASYACWSETLTVSGSVTTGNVDAEMSAGISGDDEGKDEVSSISCRVDPDNSKNLIVTVTNAYPSVNYYQEFDIHSTGSVPLIICGCTIDRGDLPACATLEISDLSGIQLHECEEAWGEIWLHLDNCAEENAEYTFGATCKVVQYNEYPACC